LTDEEIRNLIFVDYSEKQWGVPWNEMPQAITGRVPVRRENDDERYFTDRFQGQPEKGYSRMFESMLEGVPVQLGVRSNEWRTHAAKADLVIYTGKIDEYFDCCFGRLPYRSLRFEHTRSQARLPHAVINQCNKLPFTRVYDHCYFNGKCKEMECGKTIITHEYPEAHNDDNEPYYPMPFGSGMLLYQKYKKLADAERRTIFLGRLATYSYLDMWMAVAQAFVKLRPVLGEVQF
jgi:UDP-galactopyranose mutase